MVSMKIVFDDAKLAMEGLSKAELLRPIDEHFEKCGAEKSGEGEYYQDGSKALCNFTMLGADIIDNNPGFVELLSEWTVDADGEIEDWIEEAYGWYDEKRVG